MNRPSPQIGDASFEYLHRIRWLEVVNDAAEDAPGGALLETTGAATDGRIKVGKPSQDGQGNLLVAHPTGIQAGGIGLATYTDCVPAVYDPDDGTPAADETWGAAAGEWKLRKDNAGYRVVADPDPEGGMYLVEVQRVGGSGSAGSRIVAVCKVMDACTGKYMTGMRLVWEDPDGTLTCEEAEACEIGECPSVWYCVDGSATEVAVADAPPAGTVVRGPYRTRAMAEAACPPDAPPETITISGGACGANVYTIPGTLNVVVTDATKEVGSPDAILNVQNGTWTLLYDGTFSGEHRWSGSRDLTLFGPIGNTVTFTLGAECIGGDLIVRLTVTCSQFSGPAAGWCADTSFNSWVLIALCSLGGFQYGPTGAPFVKTYTGGADPSWGTPEAIGVVRRSVTTGYVSAGITNFKVWLST